jgi:hypothetical protein
MMLQNAFPKGKFNADISRNASHTILFRSNADQRQIRSISNRIFSVNSPKFMEIYAKETKTPQSYVLIDHSDATSSRRQIVIDILGDSKYVNIYNDESVELPISQVGNPKTTLTAEPLKENSKVRVVSVENFNTFCAKWPIYSSRNYDIIRVHIGDHLTEGYFADVGRETMVPATLEIGDYLLDYHRDTDLQNILHDYFNA